MTDIINMRRQIPLLFTYKDRVVGMGFIANITSHGRVLAVEDDSEVWIYGVEPGALAACGVDPKAALEAFRESFTHVLRDFAVEARSFEEFEGNVAAFFADINKPNESDWVAAVEAVRAGLVDLQNVPRQRAESTRFVQVSEESHADQRPNFEIVGSAISSTVAA